MLHAEAKEPLYQQIYKEIQKEISAGEILVGEKLPSTRLLAETLQVSRSTIDMAYNQLLSEGYIRAIPYKGYFVEENEVLLNLKAALEINRGAISRTKEVRETKAHIVCDFSPNGVDKKSFPLSTWKSMYREVLKEHGNDLFSRGESFGEETLREAISKYLYSARGVHCNKNQIVVGAGNDYLLMLLSVMFHKKNYVVGMSNTTYRKAYRIFKAYDILVEPIGMDDNGISVLDLDKKQINILYTMPSHHFPTGVVMPIGRRAEVLEWSTKGKERYLIEDDYDSEFRYRGRPIPALAATDAMDRVIYMGTFSKSLAPAIRISYMVLPKSLVSIFRDTVGFFSSSVSRLDQMMLYKFMEEGYFERHIHRMRKIYKAKRDFLIEKLKVLRSDFEISGEEAGLHLLLIDKKGRNEDMLIKKAREAGVIVYGLSSFSIQDKEKMPATILIGYAENEELELELGVQALAEVWLTS
jgi:GntR family transcriptional regulator/MocR family aminotransferase